MLKSQNAPAVRPAEEAGPGPVLSVTTVKEILAAKGIRPTRPRVQIGQLLFREGGRHFTAEQIYDEAAIFRPRPVLATIYNTLREFMANGLLREVAVYGNRIWFDTTVGPHFHYFVDGSDELFDIPDAMLPQLQIEAPPGMRVVGVDVVVRLEPVPPAND
jgi:Fur family iron response transcriptional regulator